MMYPLESAGWYGFGQNINNAFYFVIDKIVDLLATFTKEAYAIGRVVLLIALLTAALNYVLTGSGLKENLIKILKATLFFLIVTAAYPRIIGWISWYSFSLAEKSVYDTVKKHFDAVTDHITMQNNITVSTGSTFHEEENINLTHGYYGIIGAHTTTNYQTFINSYVTEVRGNDNSGLFSGLTENRKHKSGLNYTVVAPANVMKTVFFIAGECISLADDDNKKMFPEFSRILKGLVCAGVIIFTGAMALLEYVVCFLEFMLVASVGIILLPFAIWEGSKFLSEGFVKAVCGFFLKLLFCNIAIFLLLYGFITLFYIISAKDDKGLAIGFTGNVEQIIFVVFTCMLFLFICKAAPGVAQSLLTGSPSLTGAGAIGAVAGAVGAVAGTAALAKSAGNKLVGGGKAVVGGAASAVGSLIEAGSAAKEAGASGYSRAGAFARSIGRNVSQGLARSLTGGRSGDQSVGDIVKAGVRSRISEGKITGSKSR